ncbi:MAG: DMT family protein [Planctomycetia bacterium]|nr:DMT family protein [Planctomycetia bacterium]
MLTVILLICSNAFMTMAWYGHLRFKSTQLVVVILASWLIALPEYALQVPANRLGHGQFTAPQLKIIQEIISISVFLIFSFLYLRESPRWTDWAAFALIVAAVFVMLYPRLAGAISN